MIITIQVSLPMTDAQGVKESVAARLEDMGSVVRVVAIQDDGYGKQETFLRESGEAKQNTKPKEAEEDYFPETTAMIRKLMAEKNGG